MSADKIEGKALIIDRSLKNIYRNTREKVKVLDFDLELIVIGNKLTRIIIATIPINTTRIENKDICGIVTSESPRLLFRDIIVKPGMKLIIRNLPTKFLSEDEKVTNNKAILAKIRKLIVRDKIE